MRRVLVVGDIITDVYRDCLFKKMCPDAPGVQAVIESSTEIVPGGAANVALNLAALAPNALVDLIGVTSSDLAAVLKRRSGNRIGLDFIELVGNHADDLRKERICLDGAPLVRVDSRRRVNPFLREQVGHMIRDYLANHDPDLVVVSDYDGGSLYGQSDDANLQLLLTMRDRLLVDTKISKLSVFEGTLLAKLNQTEWEQALMRDPIPERFFGTLIVTRGAAGADVIVRRPVEGPLSVTHTIRVKGIPVDAVDVCGCGDTFLAGLAASLLGNSDPFTAAQFANAAAATVVTRPRTAVADREATLRMLGRTE